MIALGCHPTPDCAPLYDIKPLTGISIEVFFADHTLETSGAVWVGFGGRADGRLFAGWLAYWAVRYELRSVSAHDEIADARLLLMHERFANRTSLSMCRACDMEQPTHDDTRLESLVFTSIF